MRKWAKTHKFTSEDWDSGGVQWHRGRGDYYIDVPPLEPELNITDAQKIVDRLYGKNGKTTATSKSETKTNTTERVQLGSSSGYAWFDAPKGFTDTTPTGPENSFFTSNGTCTSWVPMDFSGGNNIITTGGNITMGCHDNNVPNNFYAYEVNVVDLSYSKEKKHDRILFSVKGTIEVNPKQDLRDSILLKHAKDLADFAELGGDVAIYVENKHSWTINPK